MERIGISSSGESEQSDVETISSSDLTNYSFVSPTLYACRKQIVDSLMTEIYLFLDQHQGLRSRAGSTGSSNSQTARLSTGTPSSTPENKRKRGDSGDENETPEDGDSDGFKKPRMDSHSSPTSPLRFACPYYRRKSQKQQKHRSCAGPGWTSVHRVK